VISPEEKIEWKHFDLICTGMRQEPVLQGLGYALYPAHFEGTKCLLMIQESSTPFQFSCVQTNFTFQDFVPLEFISWMPNERFDIGIKGKILLLKLINSKSKINLFSSMHLRPAILLHLEISRFY
jgi:hypothetical protein